MAIQSRELEQTIPTSSTMRSSTLFLLATALTVAAGMGLDPNSDVVPSSPPEHSSRGIKVKRSCEQGSWKTTRERYTTTSNYTQSLVRGITGPSRILVTKPRQEPWSNTMGLTFEEANSLGVIGLELVETAQDATEHEIIAKEGEAGFVGFTAILYCESGTATCNGGEVSGNICTPKLDKGDSRGTVIDGVWNIVLTG